MNKWRVVLSPEFMQEIRDIHSYIAYTLLNPQAAKGQVDRILDATEGLNHVPMSHSLCEEELWRSRGLRKIIVDNYVVIFFPNQDMGEVVVYHVFYGGRDINKILGIYMK